MQQTFLQICRKSGNIINVDFSKSDYFNAIKLKQNLLAVQNPFEMLKLLSGFKNIVNSDVDMLRAGNKIIGTLKLLIDQKAVSSEYEPSAPTPFEFYKCFRLNGSILTVACANYHLSPTSSNGIIVLSEGQDLYESAFEAAVYLSHYKLSANKPWDIVLSIGE